MQISHKHKFIFFSFPKTGSESIRDLLEPFSDIRGIPYWERTETNPFYSHISPVETRQLFEQRGWNFDDYYKFTFIRNPWTRIVSLYNMIYHTRPRTGLKARVVDMYSRGEKPTFAEWLQTIRPDSEGAGGPPDQRWQVYGAWSIKSYAYDDTGKLLVDDIIKLEEIEQRLPQLLQKIDLPGASDLTIPHINRRKMKDYADYYDEASRHRIEELYAFDIEHFNYSFEDIL